MRLTLALAAALLTAAPLAAQSTPTPAPPRTSAARPITPRASTAPIDINTASVAELKAIPGIGDAYAERIVAGRPYQSKDELTRRRIVPPAVYTKIQTRIIARRP